MKTQVTSEKSELQSLFEPWLATQRVRSIATARSYRQAVGAFLDQLPDEGKIGPEQIASYLDSLAGFAPATRARHISSTKSFLKFAQRQGIIATSILDYLVRPRVTVSSFNNYLDETEATRLLAAARETGPRSLACCLLLLGTGVRVEEATELVWKDIFQDPKGRRGLRVLGKGNKERVVALRDDVFAAIVAIRPSGSDALDARDQTPILTSRLGHAYSTRGLHKVVHTAGVRAGLDKEPSPHTCRHTHATLAALGGATVFSIRDSLGHARIETSQRYVSWALGLDFAAADFLPSFDA